MESSALYLPLFHSWQMIAVCILVMLLLPLVFYIASGKSRKKVAAPRPPRRPRPVAAPAPAAADGPQTDDGPAARADRAGPPE
jgi:hypothetical protein